MAACGATLHVMLTPSLPCEIDSNLMQDPSPIRVIIGDDHPVVRDGLKTLLTLEGGIEVVGEAADGDELLRLSIARKPDAVIADLAMPKVSGLTAIRQLRKRFPEMLLLVLTGADLNIRPDEAMEAGADAFLRKSDDPSLLVAEIRQGLSRPTARSRDGSTGGDRVGPLELTTREIEVLKLLAEGYDLAASAALLGISEHTVRKHRENLMSKLGTSNVAKLTVEAVRRGLVVP